MTSLEKRCPSCGADLSPESVEGLCLKCLGRLGFLSDFGNAGPAGLLRVGDYELLEEIARGGMGVVYRARQLSLNRIVALKVVLHGPFSSPDFVRRFRQEAEMIASLRHPNIVTIYDVGEHNGNHYLSLEYVEGRNFADLARGQPLPARQAAGYLKTVAEAVQHAHRRGILHRDLKPSNILLDSLDRPRVTDFGLAKLMNSDTELTATGQVLGSPNFMPPEQAGGKWAEISTRSDVYSLGAILYELLTGRPPFQAETLQAILEQVRDAEPLPPQRLNPDTPLNLQTICLKCLQKEPSRRYGSAQELADDLNRFLKNEPIRARPVPPLERAWLWRRRHPVTAAMSVALLTVVVAGVAGIVWEWRKAEFHAQGESKQRLIAEQDAAETRLNLYAADVAEASQAMQNANYGLARRTLEALQPKPGEADLRGFEWRYLWNRCRGDQLATLTGHTLIVTCAAFSPDGTFLATGSHDGTVRIWDVAHRTNCAIVNATTNAVWSVAFTPDGKELMAGCNEKVGFWETGSWRLRTNFPGELAALSRKGTVMATAESSPFFWQRAGAVKLWNWRTGEMLRTFDRPGRALALSSDGGLLAVAGPNAGIIIWDTATGQRAHEWPTPEAVWSLNFSPDDRRLITTGWSSNISVWPMDGISPPRTLSGHQFHAWSAVYSGDGATIATTSSDETARLWDATTLEPKSVLRGHNSEVWCSAFSPDGRLLATGGKDHDVLLWSVGAAHSQKELPYESNFRPIFSPDGKRLVTVDPLSGVSMLWDTEKLIVIDKRLAEGRQVVGFSTDGKLAASFDTPALKLQYWPTGAREPEREVALEDGLAGRRNFVYMGMSPEKESFFAIDAGGLVQIWHTQTGKLARILKGPAPPIRNAVLSAMGKRMAVCVEDENVARLYDCATGAERRLAGHLDFVSGLAFSPDGSTLATGSMDGTVRLWDTSNGETIASLPAHIQEATDVAFSPDGRTLASLGRNETLKLWHVPTLREVVSEPLPETGSWLAFSPDGRRLAVEIGNNKLQLLQAPSE